MPVPMDPTSAAFLFAENRQMPMHVGGLQLFEKPEGAPRDYARQIYEQMSEVDEIAPLFLKRPTRGITTAGQWAWTQDDNFDLEYHFRHSALPKPGRVRELLELCSRLHSTRLARERPLWEAHLIEGLRDGRVALYTKMHHSLVDGISAMRLLQSVMTTDPDKRDMPAMWAARPSTKTEKAQDGGRAQPGRRTPRRDAYGARHHRRRRRTARRPGQDAQARPEERDLGALALRAAHDVQHHHHRVTPLRGPGLADRAAAGDRQGQRHHPQRRRAGDVLRRDPHLPDRARRPARLRAGLDGPGRPERQAVPVGLRRGRQRRRRGDGQARHRARTTRPTASPRSTPR